MNTTILPGQTMMIRIRKSFATNNMVPDFKPHTVLIGSRIYSHDDGPFEVDAKKAEELIRQGLADAVVEMPISKAQRAVEPKLEASRRG